MAQRMKILMAALIVFATLPFSIAEAGPISANCTDKATFVSDVTIADKSKVEPGKSFDKIWRLKNGGTCTWSTSYALVFSNGHQMGGPSSVSLSKSTSPGETIDLKVTLTAPTAQGTHTGYWKLRNADGSIFGIGAKADQPFWVQIVVGKASSATPVPSSSGTGSWKGQYFANSNLWGSPKVTRTDSKIDFNWKRNAPASGIPADNFSVRWTTTAEFETGIYRFYLFADDSARLRVGDRTVLRVPAKGSPEAVYDLALLKGKQQLVVEYREFTGPAQVRLTWQKVASPTYPDWKGQYWTNNELKGDPAITRNDKAINFRWNEKAPVLGMPRDDFSARWTRTVKFAAGTYRFYAIADDGMRVFIDGKRVLNEWPASNTRATYTFERNLNGNHTIVVEHQERKGNAIAKFWWEKVTPTPTPTVTPTPTATAPPVQEPEIVYSFAQSFCDAAWSSEAESLPCLGTEGAEGGYVLRTESVILENGVVETRMALVTHPQMFENGLIRGIYPAFLVQSGDRFQTTIGCQANATACDVTFQLGYRLGEGEIQPLASWTEVYDGQTRAVDVDLTPLTGKSVQIVLTVQAKAITSQNQAVWVLPRILR